MLTEVVLKLVSLAVLKVSFRVEDPQHRLLQELFLPRQFRRLIRPPCTFEPAVFLEVEADALHLLFGLAGEGREDASQIG